MRSARAVIVAATLVIASASPAVAQDVRGPGDGATVTSEPVFSFDPAATYAEVELSRTADLATDGTFVDPAYADAFVLDREPRDGIARWRGGRIIAGTYLWHARVRDANYERSRATARQGRVVGQRHSGEGHPAALARHHDRRRADQR